jgi:MoxR-like ATPase
MRPELASVDAIESGFAGLGYICSTKIATAVFLAAKLGKPVLVEGPPGVGKTELAKTAAALLELPLYACSATRASTRPRPSTSGSTASSFCTRRY